MQATEQLSPHFGCGRPAVKAGFIHENQLDSARRKSCFVETSTQMFEFALILRIRTPLAQECRPPADPCSLQVAPDSAQGVFLHNVRLSRRVSKTHRLRRTPLAPSLGPSCSSSINSTLSKMPPAVLTLGALDQPFDPLAFIDLQPGIECVWVSWFQQSVTCDPMRALPFCNLQYCCVPLMHIDPLIMISTAFQLLPLFFCQC